MNTALVVDDSSTEREILTGYLKAMGINTEIAVSGEEALQKIESEKPDLIILDVVLPGRSGFEICREIKAGNSTNAIPIIMCSTKGSEMDKFWGMKQGADAYLPKPVNKEQFIHTVSKLIK